MADVPGEFASYYEEDPGYQPDVDDAVGERARGLKPAFVVETTKGKRTRKQRPKPAEPDPNDTRPVIRIAAGQLDRLATEA